MTNRKVTAEMELLAEGIAEIIKDYEPRPYPYDADHVLRWAIQHKPDNQLKDYTHQFILEQAYAQFSNHYFNKEWYTRRLTKIICNIDVKTLLNSSFLDIQQAGKSQSDMLDMLDSIANDLSRPALSINDYTKNSFVYFDDIIYTGDRAYHDLKVWIEDDAPDECTLNIYTLHAYSWGIHNLTSRIYGLIERSGKQIRHYINAGQTYENRVFVNYKSDVFWPKKGQIIIPAHLNQQRFTPRESDKINPWRTGFEKSRVFSNSENRDLFEKILCEAGFEIISQCKNPKASMKPLGYNTFPGLGFGGTVFTYRNCANNTPLSFWWGNPLAEEDGPLSKWYPLLMRKTY